ncbi:TMEM175 family protein [Paractinoplanes toevensis]|uniref:DUF1211 domain-containing protein n=1 Tax=Paractinoplanes toevensis TaxID=571911 RepID=A0A919TCX1_9ACTN|nr:TMEM175 family protein [Actinoplanes toevensis]GIM93278.1 hypothetical protein Ato02nite_050710 [Actinoplanes toevensis]
MIAKERDGSERLVMFTDAVAAIALTLLILPLLETVAEVPSFDELVHEHRSQFGARHPRALQRVALRARLGRPSPPGAE